MSTRGYSGLRRAYSENEMARALDMLSTNVVLDIFEQCDTMEKARMDAEKRTAAAYLREHPELKGVRE